MNTLREFHAIYRSYRRFHGMRYALRRAFDGAFRSIPF